MLQQYTPQRGDILTHGDTRYGGTTIIIDDCVDGVVLYRLTSPVYSEKQHSYTLHTRNYCMPEMTFVRAMETFDVSLQRDEPEAAETECG